MSKTKELKLNERQKMFCRCYAKNFNGTKAAIEAGYSEKTADSQAVELKKLPRVSKEIERLKQIAIDKLGVDKEFYLKRVLEIYKIATQRTKTKRLKRTFDKDGNETSRKYVKDALNLNLNAACNVLDKIERYLGIKKKLELSNDPDNPIQNNNVIFYIPDNKRDNPPNP